MIKIQADTRGGLFKAVVIASMLTACASSGPEKKQVQFDTALIRRIELKIGMIKQASIATTLSQPGIVDQVSKNLTDWGYPISIGSSKDVNHTLIAEIGSIEFGETPAGFSFSVGNSDPRAIDFQKTNVLPISCELASIEHPEQTRYLHMEFAVGDVYGLQVGNSIGADKLVDHISTVCFNLLSELDWPDKTLIQPTSSYKPGWVPEVRIETVSVPVDEEKADAQGKSVTTHSEDRKQIIIHNQGSAMVLKFGHERR